MRNWLFRLLFRKEYGHMGHLIDDVITLELKLQEQKELVKFLTWARAR